MSPFCRKQRVCRNFAGATYFKPRGIPLRDLEINTLELDELEAIHFCDYEDLEQRQAAEKMNISTSTLQRLLYSGRKKIIDALYNSKAIKIIKPEHVFEKSADDLLYANDQHQWRFKNNKKEERSIMKKIIIPDSNGSVSEHFGHAPTFALFEIEENKIIQQTSITNPGHQPGVLPKFFHEQGVNLVITGGMGARAIELFKELNIDVIVGVRGRINDVIKQVLEGTLRAGNSTCHGSHKNCQHDSSCKHEE
jgi:predicted DNA-binding protein (UPF0251 family)/predicted Fe-Mo cluster-binding NifX family protein